MVNKRPFPESDSDSEKLTWLLQYCRVRGNGKYCYPYLRIDPAAVDPFIAWYGLDTSTRPHMKQIEVYFRTTFFSWLDAKAAEHEIDYELTEYGWSLYIAEKRNYTPP